MWRKVLSGLALFLLLLAAPRSALPTTLFPCENTCPVCGETFMVMALGSYFTSGLSRDLSNLPMFEHGGVKTCPHCLYSALGSDFGKVGNQDREALRAMLPSLTIHMQPSEPPLPGGMIDEEVSYALARECYRVRTLEPDQVAEFALHLFYAASERPLRDARRSAAIEALSKALNAGAYSELESAILTYLVGELHRQGNDDQLALLYFARAAEIASHVHWSDDEERRPRPVAWVGEWCQKQSEMITLKHRSTESLIVVLLQQDDQRERLSDDQDELRDCILRTLMDRDDESWTHLSKYAGQSASTLNAFLWRMRPSEEELSAHPQFWQMLMEQNQWIGEKESWKRELFSADELVQLYGTLQHLYGDKPWVADRDDFESEQLRRWLQQADLRELTHLVEFQTGPVPGTILGLPSEFTRALNPTIAWDPSPKFPSTLRVLKTPPGWDDHDLKWAMCRLLGQGDRAAGDAAIRLLRLLGGSADASGWPWSDDSQLLAAVADSPSAWRLPAYGSMSHDADLIFLWNCLAYLQERPGAGEFLLRQMELVDEERTATILLCMAARKDVGARELRVAQIEASDGRNLNDVDVHYLGETSTANDLPRLYRLSRLKFLDYRGDLKLDYKSTRLDIERIMLRLRLEAVLERSRSVP